ncbi:glycosyltransferase [Nocardioides marmoraquaticus]
MTRDTTTTTSLEPHERLEHSRPLPSQGAEIEIPRQRTATTPSSTPRLASHPDARRPDAIYSSARWRQGVALLVTGAVCAWAVHHLSVVAGAVSYQAAYPVLFTVMFLLMGQQLVMAWWERPYVTTTAQDEMLAGLRVAVVVPVYNEDEPILRRALVSLLDQTRRPQVVVVVNDGSRDKATDRPIHYAEVRSELERLGREVGVDVVWLRQDNAGKRHAQVAGFRASPAVDVFVTVDSDSVLDSRAVEEGLKPFADHRVQSVGGINVGLNTEHNLLTRLSDLLHIQWQLITRSAQNVRRQITVNSGRLAFYRSAVCLDNTQAYLSEEFLGRHVEYSDDSLLTMFAIERGRTVQQPTAITLTWHPENVAFLVRQRLRWMRGWFIRSFWRMRYLPLSGYAFWSELLDLFRLALGTVLTTLVLVVGPIWLGTSLTWQLFVVPVALCYASALRYLAVRRSDQRTRDRLLVVALAPAVLLWAWFVLRPLRLYAMLTCRNTGWGTRDDVEVEALVAAPTTSSAASLVTARATEVTA